ncbi:hypothetical protein [Nocardioides sp.]|uniref:hypothetical protein n=1 Tax=Nocardioides sp. TaxID=35761 RepID=UPI003784B277
MTVDPTRKLPLTVGTGFVSNVLDAEAEPDGPTKARTTADTTSITEAARPESHRNNTLPPALLHDPDNEGSLSDARATVGVIGRSIPSV